MYSFGHRVCFYLVIRTRNVLGYQEFFGPMPSNPHEAQHDADRLYGKANHTITVVAWSKAKLWQKQQAKGKS